MNKVKELETLILIHFIDLKVNYNINEKVVISPANSCILLKINKLVILINNLSITLDDFKSIYGPLIIPAPYHYD